MLLGLARLRDEEGVVMLDRLISDSVFHNLLCDCVFSIYQHHHPESRENAYAYADASETEAQSLTSAN